MISFADLSHHQEDATSALDVDLVAYAAAGHDRIALKATEGLDYVDPWFREWWALAGRLGLARVAYHFARAGNHGGRELAHVLEVLRGAGGLGPRDRLCLDTEDTTAVGRADEHAAEFTAAAVARGVTSGLVYSGRWYAGPAHLRPDDVAPGWRQLWISDYSSVPDGEIRLPTGWARGQVVARQIGSTTWVPGISRPCDYSRVLHDWLLPPKEDPMAGYDQQALVRAIHDDVASMLADSTHSYLPPVHRKLTAVTAELVALRGLLAGLQAPAGSDPRALQTAMEAAMRTVLGNLDEVTPPAA